MLIAGVLKFDSLGRIIASNEIPTDFNGGTPTDAQGALAAAGGASADVHLAAIGYLNLGRITDSDSPLVPREGPITNRDGQLRISTDPPTHWYAGLPLTEAGFLSISPGDVPPPVDLGAFDEAFDNAFDIGD